MEGGDPMTERELSLMMEKKRPWRTTHANVIRAMRRGCTPDGVVSHPVRDSGIIAGICIISILVIVAIFVIGASISHAQVMQPARTGTASWYSTKSCHREGTSGIMANGRKLDDTKFTAASWDYPFGKKLRITNLDNKKSVVVVISDRGPAKRLYRQGRIVDLSKAAFESIAVLGKGIIKVMVEEV